MVGRDRCAGLSKIYLLLARKRHLPRAGPLPDGLRVSAKGAKGVYFCVFMNPRTSAAISSALVSSAKWPGVEYVDLRVRYVLAVAFRLSEVEREIVPAPEHQQPWLRFLYPFLPLWIGIDVRAIVVEEIALNLRLSWSVQERPLIGPKIGVIELNLRIVSDMARLRGCQRQQVFAQRFFVAGRSAQNARRVAQFAPRPSL